MKPRLVQLVACTLPLVAVACGSRGATPSRTPQAGRDGAIVLTADGHARSAAYAPAGTAFDVRLDQAVDTRLSKPGEAVTATLMQPILAFNGDPLVPEGTQLHGRIANIYHSPTPAIVLSFDSLALPGGAVPLGVSVLTAQESRYRTLPSPPGVTNLQPPNRGAAAEAQPTEQISMAKGAVLKLSLTTPIIEGRER